MSGERNQRVGGQTVKYRINAELLIRLVIIAALLTNAVSAFAL